MKKNFVVALVAMFVLSIAGTAFAAANPFVDVPAKHWAYEAVSKLAKAGIVDGYGDGTFRGDKTITRYEMAQIVAKAMAKSDKADAQQKATIDKLAVEFAAELNNLGVRVAKLEKQASNIKVQGETYLWYENYDATATKVNGGEAFNWRQRIHLSAPVTDKISYNARIQATGTFDNGAQTSAAAGGNVSAQFTRNFITVKDLLGVDSMMVGRIPLAIGRAGLGFGDTDNNDGFRIDHKFGKAAVTAFAASEAADTDVAGLNVDWNANKSFLVNAAYYTAEPTTGAAASNYTAKADFLNAGFAYEFSKGVSLVGDYMQSDVAGDPKAYAAQVVYNWKSGKRQTQFHGWQKMVNELVAHDQAVGFTYVNADSASTPGFGTGNVKATKAIDAAKTDDLKAYVFAYQNMVNKNVLFELNYIDMENKAGTTSDKKYYAAFEFYY